MSVILSISGAATEKYADGDGSLPETTMFAKYPNTPSGSMPGTPGALRRRIRCKMCRCVDFVFQ